MSNTPTPVQIICRDIGHDVTRNHWGSASRCVHCYARVEKRTFTDWAMSVVALLSLVGVSMLGAWIVTGGLL